MVLFVIEAESGTLTLCDRLYCAQTPRDLYLTGHQLIIASQDANCLQFVAIDPDSCSLRLLDTAKGIAQLVGFVQ